MPMNAKHITPRPLAMSSSRAVRPAGGVAATPRDAARRSRHDDEQDGDDTPDAADVVDPLADAQAAHVGGGDERQPPEGDDGRRTTCRRPVVACARRRQTRRRPQGRRAAPGRRTGCWSSSTSRRRTRARRRSAARPTDTRRLRRDTAREQDQHGNCLRHEERHPGEHPERERRPPEPRHRRHGVDVDDGDGAEQDEVGQPERARNAAA